VASNSLYEGSKFPDGGAVGNVFNVFTGITAYLGVRDTDAFILKLSYNVTLLGKIVFASQGSLHD
jgi:hypothetical protein